VLKSFGWNNSWKILESFLITFQDYHSYIVLINYSRNCWFSNLRFLQDNWFKILIVRIFQHIQFVINICYTFFFIMPKRENLCMPSVLKITLKFFRPLVLSLYFVFVSILCKEHRERRSFQSKGEFLVMLLYLCDVKTRMKAKIEEWRFAMLIKKMKICNEHEVWIIIKKGRDCWT